MVSIADYGSVGGSAPKTPRTNMKLLASVLALAAVALVAITTLATQDDGMATLAAFNKQEMQNMLVKAKTMSTSQLQQEVNELEAEKQDGESMRTSQLVTVNQNTAANPEGGVLENVPATIVAPVPGPPDFNGASAVVARLPNIGFAPSMLTEKGFETRGSFTVRKSRAGESFYLRVYGKLNHNIRCTLRGYRNLMGDFTGNTIYTGFKKIYNGKSQIQTGHIPRGIVGEFDIMTCRDVGNGEVQYFRIRYA